MRGWKFEAHNEQTATAKTTLKFFPPPPFSRDGRGGNSSQFRGFQKEEGGNKYRSLPSPPRHFGSSLHFPILFFPVSKTICDTAPRYFSHIKLQRIQSFFFFFETSRISRLDPAHQFRSRCILLFSFLFFSRFYFLFSTEEKKETFSIIIIIFFISPAREREIYRQILSQIYTVRERGWGEWDYFRTLLTLFLFLRGIWGVGVSEKKRAAQK